MSKFTALNPSLYDYMLDKSLREHKVLEELRHETESMENSEMQIAPNQGQFMQLLVRLTDARRIVEVGTFTGYSSLSMALAMPDDGRITACDVSEEWTNIARKYWEKAGVSSKIDLRLAPALDTLQALLEQWGEGSYDLAFIDADKENYTDYYEYCLKLIRPGGLVLIDNVLWEGKVLNSEDPDVDTAAIQKLNDQLKNDDRIYLSMIPLADGIAICMKI